MTGSPQDLDGVGLDELKRLLLEALAKISELTEKNAALRAEIARLKGLKGPPQFKPSGMEKASTPPAPRGKGGRGGGGGSARMASLEERLLSVAVPIGSRFKGYETYVVQNLEIRSRLIRYRRERWLTPDGRTVTAPLPPGTIGHFGAELRRFILSQYHQGQVTVARLVKQLRDFGLSISKRQVMRLLIAGQERFISEARAVLRAGLSSAPWITVDDYWGAPQGGERLLHADRQCAFCLVRHDGLEEPAELPRTAACGSRGLCDQRRSARLYARAQPRRTGDRLARQPGRHPFRRSQGMASASRPPRHSRARRHARPRVHRHRRRALGQHQGARLPSHDRDRQR